MPNDPSDVAFDDGWEALLETATLVDVRGAGELEADGSLPDALHIPLKMGDAPGAWVAAATARLPDKNAPILCFCAVGGRSRRAPKGGPSAARPARRPSPRSRRKAPRETATARAAFPLWPSLDFSSTP